VDRLYNGKEISNKNVLISTYQSLAKKTQTFFSKFDVVITDEAHTISGISIQNIMKSCVNAEYRIGLTGTLPSGEATKWTLFGYLGPVVYTLKSKELIEQGILSKITINNLILKYPNTMLKSRMDYQQEVKDIIEYENRNKALDYIIEKSDKTHNTLILVQRIEHLKDVKEYLETKYKEYSVYDYYGDSLPEYRELIRKQTEVKGSVIIVGSFATMSTGINIKRLHNIVFFASYKSEIKIIQSIGRGLRKHETKEQMILWDCVDDLRYREGNKMIKNYTYKHWINRKEYYQEQGFSYSDITLNI
jgi:superfamily II DNA or RNA helicase